MANQFQFLTFLITLLLCSIQKSCHSFYQERLGHNILNMAMGSHSNWKNLEFQAGDIIHCGIIGRFPYHVMMATSPSTIAHVIGDIVSGKGGLREESWSDFHESASPHMEHCWIHSGVGSSLSSAVEIAKADIAFHGKHAIHYNIFTCNSEHWVRYWAFGNPYSRQYRRGTDKKCKAGLHRTNVTIYRNRNQNDQDAMVLNIEERQCISWPKRNSWNKSISKIILGDMCIRVWTGMKCQGRSICFCENQDDLRYRMMTPKLSWDNRISSLSLCNYVGKIETVAILFEHRDFLGAGRKMLLQKDECVSFFPGDWWKDRVTSVKLIYGCLEYFTEVLCSGMSYKVFKDKEYVGWKYANQISSIKPC